MKTKILGTQYLAEYYGCCREFINDKDSIRNVMIEAAKLAKVTIVADVFHEFNPHGISGVVVIAESHFAIHSWPEHLCVSVDLFTCNGSLDIQPALDYLKVAFKAEKMEVKAVPRGQIDK